MKKRLTAVLSAVLAVSMLAGCGKAADGNSGNKSETGTVQTEDKNETTGTDAAVNIHLSDVDVESYVTLTGEYKGLALTVLPKTEITEEQAESLALNVYNGSLTAEYGITDRAVAQGDTVNIDYAGTQDVVAFEGGTADNQSLVIGSGSFIEGFEDGLVGVMPGETVELNLTFPEDYRNADMAGVEVVFTVTVNFIYLSSGEEMSDEAITAMSEGEYATVDAFREYCRSYLEASAEYQYKTDKETAVITALDAIASFESLPEELIAKYEANVLKTLEQQAAQSGVDVDTFCMYYYQMDSASYVESAAESGVKQSLIFQYIANKEGLHISDEELDESLQLFVEENELESVETLLEGADKEDFREYFMFEKVVDFVFENAQVSES